MKIGSMKSISKKEKSFNQAISKINSKIKGIVNTAKLNRAVENDLSKALSSILNKYTRSMKKQLELELRRRKNK